MGPGDALFSLDIGYGSVKKMLGVRAGGKDAGIVHEMHGDASRCWRREDAGGRGTGQTSWHRRDLSARLALATVGLARSLSRNALCWRARDSTPKINQD